jgi:hypothetical protein
VSKDDIIKLIQPGNVEDQPAAGPCSRSLAFGPIFKGERGTKSKPIAGPHLVDGFLGRQRLTPSNLRSTGGVPTVGKRDKRPGQPVVVRRFGRPRI